jgi:hypothetical protein
MRYLRASYRSGLMVVASLAMAACREAPRVEGRGPAGEETRTVGPFHRAEVSGALELMITVGESQSVRVQADANLLPHIVTEVKGGRLIARTDGPLKTRTRPKVLVTVPALDGVTASGATSVDVVRVSSETFDLELTGASTGRVDGQIGALKLNTAGAAHLEAQALKVRSAIVRATGASSLTLRVSDLLDAQLFGATHLVGVGRPAQVKQELNGASSISFQ